MEKVVFAVVFLEDVQRVQRCGCDDVCLLHAEIEGVYILFYGRLIYRYVIHF